MDTLNKTHMKNQIFNQKTIYCGKWMCFYTVDYYNDKGVIFKDYECLKRTTKKNHLSYDALTIIPILKYKDHLKKKILLIAEYRPPVQSFVLEFPAGLAESENVYEDIEREMKEETGYIVNKEYIYESPIVTAEPRLLDIVAKIFIVELDADNEHNKNPKQRLEAEENIRIHLIDLDNDFLKNVRKLAEENQYLIHDKIYFLGTGLSKK